MRNKYQFIKNACYALIGLWALVSCDKSDSEWPEPNRTVLVYMAADNSLNGNASPNLRAMVQGMKDVVGRLVVYVDPSTDVPRLLSIEGGENPTIDTLVTYAEENSASPAVLRRTIEEVRNRFPSESYGLILWSHGMGWLPEDYYFPQAKSARLIKYTNVPTKYFGDDQRPGDGTGASYMDSDELCEGITGHFDFILFDACFMGAVEVLYDLRDYADYFIASPAEIIADGFPYDKIAPRLWGGEADLKRVCAEYFNYYANYPASAGSDWRSATIALVKSSELPELARVTGEIVGPLGELPATNVWRYPISRSNLPDVFYDLGDYIRSYATESQQEAYEAQLEKTVLFKAATPSFFKQPIPANKFSGLSVYVPQRRWARMNQKYYELEWGRTVYGK